MLAAAGCSTAKVTGKNNLAEIPTVRPQMIYVADFDLQSANIQEDKGLLSLLPGPEGPMRQLLEGHAQNPQALARELVDIMANAIVKKLNHDGLQAVRLASMTRLPTNGWLVRGVFTEVQQGNRMRRAVIGLGLGKTDVQVATTLDNLADGPPQPFYQIDTYASSGKKPGAAATIILSPIGIPVHFVMAGGDLKKNAKHTGTKIAQEVALRMPLATNSVAAPASAP